LIGHRGGRMSRRAATRSRPVSPAA
jgi:hypothetical protein